MKSKVTLLIACFLVSAFAYAQVPSANFRSDITNGCSPIVVNFVDLSTGNPTSWKWDFGNGATSTLRNPSATYFASGTYTVTLTATNANGTNTVVKNSYITVFNEPTAAFSADRLTGCSPASIQFNDESFGPAGTTITNWKWDFGDGTSGTGKTVSHVYKNPGNYTVTLTIENDKGCKKLITKPNYINITTGVVPDFSFTDPGVCSAPATVTFTNNSTGPGTLTYSWNFGNGNTSTLRDPVNDYATNGNYPVKLLVVSSQGCSDTIVKQVVVGKANTDFNVPANICPKSPVTFTNTSTPRPIRSRWDFGNGTTDTLRNGSTTFNANGTYTVRVINTYAACIDTLEKQVTVQNPQPATFTASDTSACKTPFTVTFTAPPGASSYYWDFGDSSSANQSNPTHTYTQYGNFDVKLVIRSSTGCMDSVVKIGYIRLQKPSITLVDLPVGGCIPFTFNFKSLVTSSEPIVSYNWNFGDTSGTSTLAEPSYTYTKPGIYNITLTVSTASGCTETLTLPEAIKTGIKPKAAFTSNVTTACANPGIQFINQSTGASTYLWEFSDGSSTMAKDPLQTFLDTGWINVTLYAINNGCRDTLVKTRYAYIKPSVSRFNYKPDCNNPLLVTFTDNSIDATSWSWNFGDGTSFNGKIPPPHTFPGTGTYTVSLTTTNGACSYTASRPVIIKDQKPDISASITQGCKPFTATISLNVPDAGLITKYEWDFGDGRTINFGHGYYGQFTYNEPGIYYVKLTTTDSFGCRHVVVKDSFITVLGPKAKFTSQNNSGCKGLNVLFQDSSAIMEGNAITSWRFDFGDSTSQVYTAPPFQHVYDSVGEYDVKMVVTDQAGCVDSVMVRSFVKISTLKPDFSFAKFSCPGSSMYFQNNTISDLPLTGTFHFGDGQTGDVNNFDNIAHTYTDTGYFSVKLVVTNTEGCVDSVVFPNAIHIANPKADFTANNFTSYCTPFEAQLTNLSYFSTYYNWDFGLPNATSTQKDPSTYYDSTGIYDVKLVVTSPGGCMDSITRRITIYSSDEAKMTYSPLSGCTPRPVQFDAFTKMNGSFIWDFGDGNVLDTSVNQLTHVYTDFGNFVPRIILKEAGGTCVIPLVGRDTIRMLGVKPKFEIDRNLFCDSGTINILDSTTTNDTPLSYRWEMGDGTIYNVTNPSHTYTDTGSFNVLLIASSPNGCIDSLSRGPINIVRSPKFTIQADSVFCAMDRISYRAVLNHPDTALIRWNWVFPNGASSTVKDPQQQVYTKSGNYTIVATAINGSGCTDTVTQNILVHSLPQINLPPTITKVVGVPLKIPATYSNNITSYNWTPAQDLDCTDCPQPVTSTRFPKKYSVTVLDSNSCSNTATVQVLVLCKGATIFVPNTFSPNGDGNNDVLYVRGTGLDRVKAFRIFNRWGELVFDQRDFPTNNGNYGWKGMYKGQNAPADVYIYQAEVYCENGEVIRFEGNIALIR